MTYTWSHRWYLTKEAEKNVCFQWLSVVERRRNYAPLGPEGRKNGKDARGRAGAHTAGTCLSWWKWEITSGQLR